jgi:hypothetical protein
MKDLDTSLVMLLSVHENGEPKAECVRLIGEIETDDCDAGEAMLHFSWPPNTGYWLHFRVADLRAALDATATSAPEQEPDRGPTEA